MSAGNAAGGFARPAKPPAAFFRLATPCAIIECASICPSCFVRSTASVPIWKRLSAIWGSLLGVVLAAGLFLVHRLLRPQATRDEQVAVMALLAALVAICTGYAVRGAWQRRLVVLAERLGATPKDAATLDLKGLPADLVPVAKWLQGYTDLQRDMVEKQKRTIE